MGQPLGRKPVEPLEENALREFGVTPCSFLLTSDGFNDT